MRSVLRSRLLILISADGVQFLAKAEVFFLEQRGFIIVLPGKSCSFLIVSLSKSLSLCFMCSDLHVKYWMPHGFPLTSSLLLDYPVKQYIQTYCYGCVVNSLVIYILCPSRNKKLGDHCPSLDGMIPSTSSSLSRNVKGYRRLGRHCPSVIV